MFFHIKAANSEIIYTVILNLADKYPDLMDNHGLHSDVHLYYTIYIDRGQSHAPVPAL
jgi:hypothetical protein